MYFYSDGALKMILFSKLVNYSKCAWFCQIVSQTLSRNLHTSQVTLASDTKSQVDNSHSYFATSFGKRIRRPTVKINKEQVAAVTAVLKKHNVDISDLATNSDIFHDTSWEVEKKIMLLEELGISDVTTSQIILFRRGLRLPVQVFKAYLQLDPHKSLAESLFSHVDNHSFRPEEININEDQLTKTYLHECLTLCAKKELQLDKTQTRKMRIRSDHRVVFQSVRLFSKLLQYLQNDVKFTTNKLLKHHIWLFSLHPDQLQTIYNLIAEVTKERTSSIVQRYPPIFEHNLDDLKIIVTFLRDQVKVFKKTSGSTMINIFRTTSDELKRRYDYLSKNSFTQDFLKHPKFLNLIVLYHTILPRLRYLEEKNLQYVTIYSLTSFSPNYHEELANFKTLNRNDIKSFFQVHFGNDAEEALTQFKKHMYYRFIPLLSLKKSLVYLKAIFPYKIVRDNCYAILYNQMDLQAAYEVVTKNPENCKLPPNQLLTMCLYMIELNSHFMGDAILAPGKYAESLRESVDQVKLISDT